MKKYCFGVDVGGTTVKIGFFNVDGTMLDKWEIVTNTDNGGEAILGDICKFLDDKLAKENIQIDEVKGIGIGLPGPVLSDGTVLQCVNLGWGKLMWKRNFHLCSMELLLKPAMMQTLQL